MEESFSQIDLYDLYPMALMQQQVLGQEVLVKVTFKDHTVSRKIQDFEGQVVGVNLLQEAEVGVAEDKLEIRDCVVKTNII